MATQANQGIAASWEPGDDICPPWPGPFPIRHLFRGSEPGTAKPVAGAEQVELAHMLTFAAGLTMSKEHNAALKSLGTAVARGACPVCWTILSVAEPCRGRHSRRVYPCREARRPERN